MVFIDADILIKRSLHAVVELAAANGVAAFKDIGNPHRFCPEWSTFGIGEAVERPYVNSGFFALTYEAAMRFIPIFVGLEQRLDVADSYRGGAASTSPLYFLDQDVFNAMLCTQFADSTARLEAALVPIPPFTGLRSSQDPISCAYEDGTVPFGLHHVQRKPWLAPLSASLYSELFTTVLTTTDAPVRISPRELPLRLRHRKTGARRSAAGYGSGCSPPQAARPSRHYGGGQPTGAHAAPSQGAGNVASVTNTPLVSVVVPVYNGDEFLEECLRSIEAQTYANWQCSIVTTRARTERPT